MNSQKKREQEENDALAKELDNLAEDEDLLKGLEDCHKLEMQEL